MKKLLASFLLLVLSIQLTFGQSWLIRPQNIAELRTYSGSKATIAITLGNSVINDQSGDLYFWNETSTDSDDGLNVIQATGITTGRWVRLRTLGATKGGMLYSNTSIPAGNTITGTTTETFFTTQYTIPANSLQMGDVIDVRLWGVYSTNAIAPNVTGRVYFNNTLVNSTGAISAVAGVANAGWLGLGSYTIMSTGATGTIDGQAWLNFASAATTGLTVNLKNTSMVSIDTTVDIVVKISVEWSSNSNNNSIQLRQMRLTKTRL